MPNTIFNTSDTSDTSLIQIQYIQILPIHAEFTGLMYWMYFDVFDVNTSSKPQIHAKYTIIHGKYICRAPPDFRFWRKHIQHVLKTGSMYWYIQYCLLHGQSWCLWTFYLNTSQYRKIHLNTSQYCKIHQNTSIISFYFIFNVFILLYDYFL